MTWEECAAAGMTASEAARHRGKTLPAAVMYASRHGFAFKPAERGKIPARQFLDMLEAGATAKQIAKAVGASLTATYRRAERLGYPFNGNGPAPPGSRRALKRSPPDVST